MMGAQSAAAQESAQQAAIIVSGADGAFVLGASVIAIGLGALGAGALAAGHSGTPQRSAVILQNACITAAAALVWIVAGYGLGFGAVTNGWFGQIALGMGFDSGDVRPGTALPESGFALFRMAFAILAAALLVGAWAGRARQSWAIVFAGLWTLIVFAPITHWLWGGGWLRSQIGAIDYAGGLAVHTAAGISALVIAVLIGPRAGFEKRAVADASPTTIMLGMGLLWSASLALNGASALSANHNASAAMISVLSAGCAAGLSWLALENAGSGEPSAQGFAKGALAGLAAIAAASVYVSPMAAIIIGILAGIGCFAVNRWVTVSLGVDDPAGVFAVHGVGGIFGALLLAVFLSSGLGGTGYFGASTMLSQLTAQAIAVGAVAVWSAVGTALTALAVSMIFPMRASEA